MPCLDSSFIHGDKSDGTDSALSSRGQDVLRRLRETVARG